MVERLTLILHVGMGKTGSTSLQKTLAAAEKSGLLAGQGTRYLGMTPTFLGSAYADALDGFRNLFQHPVEEQSRLAVSTRDFLEEVHKNQGVTTFVLSNEVLTQHARVLRPFIERLQAGIDVKIIQFVRNPIPWAVSAYKQWGIRHKTYPGPIRSFAVAAPPLLDFYQGAIDWIETYPANCATYKLEEGSDILQSFSGVTGISLPDGGRRELESPLLPELLLRAAFNNGERTPTLPSAFDQATRLGVVRLPQGLDGLLATITGYGDAAAVVDQRLAMFSRLATLAGIDLDTAADEKSETMEKKEVLNQVLEMLLALCLDQSKRIKNLENRVNAMTETRQRQA